MVKDWEEKSLRCGGSCMLGQSQKREQAALDRSGYWEEVVNATLARQHQIETDA